MASIYKEKPLLNIKEIRKDIEDRWKITKSVDYVIIDGLKFSYMRWAYLETSYAGLKEISSSFNAQDIIVIKATCPLTKIEYWLFYGR